MGHPAIQRALAPAQRKKLAGLLIATALLTPFWQAHFAAPESGALQAAPGVLEAAQADTLIVYAAPAHSDPVLRISSRGNDGSWQESELQLSNDNPQRSAALVRAAVARETGEY